MLTLEKDNARFEAGWGLHYWIVDNDKPEDSIERYIKLVPAHSAEFELKKLRLSRAH